MTTEAFVYTQKPPIPSVPAKPPTPLEDSIKDEIEIGDEEALKKVRALLQEGKRPNLSHLNYVFKRLHDPETLIIERAYLRGIAFLLVDYGAPIAYLSEDLAKNNRTFVRVLTKRQEPSE